MTKNIYFCAESQNVDILNLYPKPAKNYIPEWFKKMPNKFNSSDGNIGISAKLCMPFLDSFVSGYTYELPCDIKIKYDGRDMITGQDSISYFWAGNLLKPISSRSEEFGAPNLFPKFDGYYHTELHWNSLWEPKTPKGYSTMYHHPSNRFDLPFHTMTGIIDTDNYSVPGPVPFLLKEGFEGIIPAGTPIIQISLIKRENWISSKIEYDENRIKKERYSVKKFFTGGYKKQHWNKKTFE